jgi:hypothetical protein
MIVRYPPILKQIIVKGINEIINLATGMSPRKKT